jgi:tetratricopeptide (TPR) repeat protein
MDLYFQGKALVYKGWTPEYLAQARVIFERALTLDPKNVEAMVWTAAVDLIVGTTHYTDDRATLLAAAEETVVKVLSRVPSHAFAHLMLGGVFINSNRGAEAIAECERALALDHNSAEAHALIGTAKHVMGRAAETEAHINEALRLSPRDIFAPRWFLAIGMAKLQLNADAEALCWFRRSIEANRNYPFTHFALAATLALLGSLDDARAAAKAGLALLPSLAVRRLREGASSDNPTYLATRERIYQGLRMAGVPEG